MGGGIEWLELELERLRLRVRFGWAFHAREVRFERDAGGGFESIFPEVFSFHLEAHDPEELAIQLDDLRTNPRRLTSEAARRDSEDLLRRLLSAAPAYLERVLNRLETEGLLGREARARVHGDGVVLTRILGRFLAERGRDADGEMRRAALHLRKLVWRHARALAAATTTADALATRLANSPSPQSREAPSDRALLRAVESGEPARLDPLVAALGERAFHDWLEGVCLDTENEAFEGEDSPFDSRELEIRRAVAVREGRPIRRGRDLSPFLRRPRHRDCLRLLRALEVWFLRRYDVFHAAVMIRQAARLARGRDDGDRVLSWHTGRTYLALLMLGASPFLGAAFFYDFAPRVFDVAASVEVVLVNAGALWYLLYRFCWQKDLTLFHASVPRIGAGIIVGYLPVFLIDEVWDLSRRPWFPLGVVTVLLGFTTLLYLFVEVQRHIDDPREAFVRARRIFLLGLVQAFGLGLIVTSLLGRFMVARTWAPGEGTVATLAALRAATPPFAGELPRILGIPPFVAFPTAVLLMTFMSFFIGVFLQLLWEDLPITEPL